MAGNTIGQLFRVTTWGESHGGAVGVVVDGCPSRLEISEELVQKELDRRRPGQSDLTTQRAEADRVQILSGLFEGQTLGTPISMLVRNQDARPDDYTELRDKYRPGHADYTYQQKYGIRNWQGGGRASARETIGRVAAGAIAKRILGDYEIGILGYVKSAGKIEAEIERDSVSLEAIEANPVRCPDAKAAKQMEDLILQVKDQGDSIGGIVECVVRGCPVGLGEPVFDKLDADLAKACMSIPATKGFEIGSGFVCTRMKGSEHNDALISKSEIRNPKQIRNSKQENAVGTRTNNAGGILGGISNGEDIVLRIAFKPTPTIALGQDTVTVDGQQTTISGRGRHDPCVLPRAVPVVEAVVAIVLVDHLLRYQAFAKQ